MRAPRGFTLLELLVGAVLALVISAVAMGVLVSVQNVQRDSQSRNAIARDAQFAVEQIGYDLQFVGVGVPRGTSIDGLGELRPAVRIGQPTYLAMVGDMPYPNADLNGVAVVNDIKGARTPPDTGSDDEAIITSELSPCAPESSSPGSYSCPSHQLTLVPIGAAFADKCTESASDRRTCPWGLGKWQRDGTGEVQLVFSGPAGRWEAREWAMNTSGGAGGTAVENGRLGIHLSGHGQLTRSEYVSTDSAVSVVAHLDRVFYSLESVGGAACDLSAADPNCVLMRRHCWGSIGDPSAAGFPAVGAGIITSSANPDNCDSSTSPPSGTPWETLVNGIDEFELRYFRDDTTQLATPLTAATSAQVQFIEVRLAITRRSVGAGTPLTQRMTRRFYVENAGGFVGTGAGSCVKGDPWCGKL